MEKPVIKSLIIEKQNELTPIRKWLLLNKQYKQP